MEDKNKWKIRNFNQERKHCLRVIKSQRLHWADHVIRMDPTKTVEKLTEWKPCSSRPVGKPRLRWLDQGEEDLKKMKVRNWREKCKERRLWYEIVKQAKIHHGLKRQLKKKTKKLCHLTFNSQPHTFTYHTT